MRGFFAVQKSCLDAEDNLARVRRSFERQGFPYAVELANDHWRILSLRRSRAAEGWIQFPNGGFALLTGTLFYRDLADRKALERLHRDVQGGKLDEDALWGSFAVLLVTRTTLIAMTDRTGTFHVYRDLSEQRLSSSFLALAGALPRTTIDTTGFYDYIFQEAPHGGGSIFREIRLLPSDVKLLSDGSDRRHVQRPVAQPKSEASEPLEDAAERCLTVLRDRIACLSGHYPDRIDTALSGGYDSRLILAMLREGGYRAALHVYGSESSEDVRVAKQIAAGEGLDLTVTNKGKRALVAADDYSDLVAQNFFAFDGYPNDGLFDNGADLATRLERANDDRIALNGGGGEIYRDFFYLPNRPYTAQEMAWSFFSQYDPRLCTARFSNPHYQAGLAQRIAESAYASTDASLSRDQVEFLYPYFRCRYWMGRNNSVNNRLGLAATPFIEHAVISSALQAPLQHKTMGRLQARMIAKADPALAAYPSAYGYSFDREPPLSYRLKYLGTYLRPPSLRRFTYRLRRQPPLPQQLLSPYREAVLGELAYIQDYLQIESLTDPGQLSRALTAEYLFQWANSEHGAEV